MVTHSIELLTCAQYGCPGCTFRHFHRTSDDAVLTEVPDEGMFTKSQLAAIGRAAVATGAVGQKAAGGGGRDVVTGSDAPSGAQGAEATQAAAER